MDQASNNEVIAYTKKHWIKVNGFTEFERKGLYFPIDILVKSYNTKTDMFEYQQYFRVEFSKSYDRSDYWSHCFYSNSLWDHIRFKTKLVGYRPTICNTLVGTCEASESKDFESMLLEDVGT